MTRVSLKIAELRKKKGIGQQELAGALGVSFQAVSKWETGSTFPDITLLPSISEYFDVTVDELLGLKPLMKGTYIPRDSDDRNSWNGKTEKLYKNRKYFWNDDYLCFLVRNVWKIDIPVNIVEFRCGEGYFGKQLLELLPVGSTYTGVDNEFFIEKARENLREEALNSNFIISDLYSFEEKDKYDVVICQVGLRHLNRPMELLEKMVESTKLNGLVICVDVNREFEEAGLYIDGMDYDRLCTAFDFHKVWRKELEKEGRDYAIGMRLPFYMQKLGLRGIDIRMNDRVTYVNPEMEDYDEKFKDFVEINEWDQNAELENREEKIERLMSRGLDRFEVEAYFKKQEEIIQYFKADETKKSFLKVLGLLIAYGRK